MAMEVERNGECRRWFNFFKTFFFNWLILTTAQIQQNRKKKSKIASRFLALETEVLTKKKKKTEEEYGHKRRESNLARAMMDSLLDMPGMRWWQL